MIDLSNKKKQNDLLCRAAHLSIFIFPKIALISMRASVSSDELKMGNFLARKESKMIPADQISMA